MIPADYKISLNDGTVIPLLFNTWTFREYSRKKGIDFEALVASVTGGDPFKSNDIPDLLLKAAESYCRFNGGKEFNYNDLDSCLWVDSLGGAFNAPALVELFKVFICKLLNISPEKFDVLSKKEKADNAEPQKKRPAKH